MKIFTIPGGSLYTNCYMVWQEEGNKCILIDPGFDAEQILEQVRSRGKEVEAVLLTHGHFDHVGGVKDIAAETGCKVYIHKADLALPNRLTLGTVPCTHHYEDGDTLVLAGLTLKVLHTPGHTPGGVCLLCENAMFSGDTLFAGTCGRTDLPGSDHRKMWDSLARLAALEEDYLVLPGHGESSTLSVEKRSNPYLQVRQ
ncbi:MAG: MBL fold metallo-hydrolase [Oscillospiraceae bacterium]|nr:MBL fold metallo-hydrolase [Oscillospiraceae bacterium]